VAVIASACTAQCAAQATLPCSWATQGFDCVTDVCEDAVAPNGIAPTAPGCEDLYVGMNLCWGDLGAAQWECSDQGPGWAWPAPVAGTACEAATCAWNCCDYNGGGIISDMNFLGPRCNNCQ
jgi:hypothetical protein